MSYLMVQIILCLLIAALIGFIVGWWLSRKRQEDVEADLNRQLMSLQEQVAAARKQRDDIENRLTALQATHSRCVDAQTRVSDMQLRLEAVQSDYDELQAEYDELRSQRSSIPAAIAVAPGAVGAAAARKKIARLEAQLTTLRDAQRETVASRDSLAESVEQYEAALADNARRIHELEAAADDSALLAENARLREELAAAVTQLGELGHGTKPAGLLEAAPQSPDDLKRIKGVGPVMQRTLNALGIYYFYQVAALTPAEISWVSHNINTFPGRIARDQWVEQAAAFAAEPGSYKPE